MVPWADYYYESLRYRDLRREADQYRLIRQATDGQPKGASRYRRARSWLGCRLTMLGYRLMEQPGEMVDAVPTC